MSGIRLGLAAFCAAFVIAPAAAWGIERGEQVTFPLPSEQGESYTVSVDGTQVAQGTDDTESFGLSVTFTMPDLGPSTRTVTVLVVVSGDSGTRSYSRDVEYTPGTVAPSTSPAPARPKSPSKQALPTPIAAPDGSGQRGSSRRGAGRSRGESGGVLGTARSGKADAKKPRAKKKTKKRKAKKRKRKTNDIRQRPDPPAVHGSDVPSPRDTRADLSDESFPGFGYSIAWKLLAAVALMGLLVPVLLGARARAQRRRLEEEAALQEQFETLVAELNEARAPVETLQR